MADKEFTTEGKRFFYGMDDVTKYYIESPTADNIRGSDWQYSKTYTQCLMEGITTSVEMIDILTRRGIIGPEFEARGSELGRNLGALVTELEDTTNMEKKRELAVKVAQARDELYQWNQRLNGPMNHTAEQMSDDAKLGFLTSCMIVDEKGNRVWNNYEDYLKDSTQSLTLKARFEVMLYLQGLSSDFLDQTPEAKAMKEVQQDLFDRAKLELEKAKIETSPEVSEIEAVIEEKASEAEEVAKEDNTPKVSTRKPKTKK